MIAETLYSAEGGAGERGEDRAASMLAAGKARHASPAVQEMNVNNPMRSPVDASSTWLTADCRRRLQKAIESSNALSSPDAARVLATFNDPALRQELAARLLDTASDHILRRRVVWRAATALSLAEAPVGDPSAAAAESEDEEVPWASSPCTRQPRTWALRKRENLGVKMTPALDVDADDGVTVLRDETILIDRIYRCSPIIAKVLLVIHDILYPVASFLGLLANFTMPFSILLFTNTTTILESGIGNATNEELWAPAWSDVALLYGDAVSALWIYLFIFQVFFFSHPGMTRRIWSRQWPSLLVKLGTAWGYAGFASSLQPARSHIIWLIFFKVAFPLFMVQMDTTSVIARLRMHQAHHDAMHSKKDSKGKARNSCVMVMLLFVSALTVAYDIGRHLLIMNVSDDVNVINFNMTNPFTGSEVGIDNLQITSSLYWTSTLFLVSGLYTNATRAHGEETITDVTPYKMTRVKRS